MRCAATGETISVANRRSTRQAQLWHETGPSCDEEYDRTKLNNFVLLENGDDLAIGKTGRLHAELSKI